MIFHLFLQKQQIDPVNSISFFQYKISKKNDFFCNRTNIVRNIAKFVQVYRSAEDCTGLS
jgi:hypothetical protein